MANATTNPYNPPPAQEPVLANGFFSFAWYQWLTGVVAKILRAPASASTPATAVAAGVPGQIAYDQNFVYVCVGTNSWKRAALAAF